MKELKIEKLKYVINMEDQSCKISVYVNDFMTEEEEDENSEKKKKRWASI